MKLYYSPGACSMAPHIALNWVGAEFELIKPDDTYSSINSMRQVPTLILDDGTALTQCNAILRFIAESHPEAGIGGADNPRAQYPINRWLSFVTSDLHRAHAPYFFQPRYIENGNDEDYQRIKQAAEKLIGTLHTQCDTWLADGGLIGGDKPCIADAYAFTVFRWSRKMAKPAYSYTNIKAYMDRMLADEGVQLTMQREGLE